MISGKTTLIAHLGYPTEAFKAPMIYNPWFDKAGIDAVVVPMGVTASDYPQFVDSLFRLTNIRGALVTMPHKVATGGLVQVATIAHGGEKRFDWRGSSFARILASVSAASKPPILSISLFCAACSPVQTRPCATSLTWSTLI